MLQVTRAERVARGSSKEFRDAIYRGVVYVFPPTSTSEHLVRVVTGLLRDVLGIEGDVRRAQYRMTDAQMFERVGRVRALLRRPLFRAAAKGILSDIGVDASTTVFDAVRLRAIVDGGHRIPAAVPAYAAHRDTWYANPSAQINAWIPLFDLPREQSFAFYPEYFARPIPNSSSVFDYPERVRTIGFQNYEEKVAPAAYPAALVELDASTAVRFAMLSGEVLVFSAAHLHQTMPNESGGTRFSVDFRTVHLEDHACGRGAPRVDDESRGSALVDYSLVSRASPSKLRVP